MLNSRRLRTDTQTNFNHEYAGLGSFVRADGTTAVMADVNLATDAFHRSFKDVIPTNALTAALPDMQAGPEQGRRGSGMARMKVNVTAAKDVVFEVMGRMNN